MSAEFYIALIPVTTIVISLIAITIEFYDFYKKRIKEFNMKTITQH